ncbi:MAG: SDR family NAD(P)-dependent oxidoreductase [Myxococcota bacterium]
MAALRDWLNGVFAGRPGWMNALMVFCAYMAFVYVPWDFFVKPVAEDQEVWLGVMFTGAAAKFGEPLHWAIYAAGAYGFYRKSHWMWPWASIYVWSVAIGMGIWPVVYHGGVMGLGAGVLGFILFALLAVQLWRAQAYFAAHRASLRERYPGWALVTGSSGGIGEYFARALAAEGISCVLCARREPRLQALADELQRAEGVEVRVVVADLASADGVAHLLAAVADLPISILVNNAGFGAAGPFAETDGERLNDMVALHCAAPVALSHALLPAMRDRGNGALLFTGSIAGRQAIPLHGLYAASKGFQLLFGESLHVELCGPGIDVLVVEPGVTDTEFQKLAGERPLRGEPPARVVEEALNALGRQSSLIPGWWDWLRANAAARLVPRRVAAFVARDVFARRLL